MDQDCIRTFSGIVFSPFSPGREDICMDDIAHSLSLLTRANGHFPEFYSVGQHCIACCREALARGYGDRVALACLLHDAGEAYMSDVPRPVKKRLVGFEQAEERLLELVYSVFLGRTLDGDEQDRVDRVDGAMLYHEFLHYTGMEIVECKEALVSVPEFRFVEFEKVEKEYKELFFALREKL